MSNYQEGLKLIEEKFGNGKDNVISLATITQERGGVTESPVQLSAVWMPIMKMEHFMLL